MAKSTRKTSKKTSRSARSGGTKTAAKGATPATNRAARKPAAKRVNGTPVASRPKAGKAAKSRTAKKTSRGRGSRSQIDVKVGSFGGKKPGSFGFDGSGASTGFLSGKPGSIGSGGLDQPTQRLTRTKLGARDLRHFRDLLLAKRRQLLGDMETMENEALRSETSNLSHLPVHMADMGTDNYEQEFTLSLVDRDRQLVDMIDAALRKIDDKTYGICEGTGQMISKERLEAQPWAKYSIEYARLMQRPGFRR